MKERWEMGTQTMLDRLCNTGATRDIALELFQAKYRNVASGVQKEQGDFRHLITTSRTVLAIFSGTFWIPASRVCGRTVGRRHIFCL